MPAALLYATRDRNDVYNVVEGKTTNARRNGLAPREHAAVSGRASLSVDPCGPDLPSSARPASDRDPLDRRLPSFTGRCKNREINLLG